MAKKKPKNRIRVADLDVNQILKVIFGGMLIETNIDKMVDIGFIRHDLKERTRNLLTCIEDVSRAFWLAYGKDNGDVEDKEMSDTYANFELISETIGSLSSVQVHLVTCFIARLKDGQFNSEHNYNMVEDYLLFKHQELVHHVYSNMKLYVDNCQGESANFDLDENWKVTNFYYDAVELTCKVAHGVNQVDDISNLTPKEITPRNLFLINDYLYKNHTIKYEFTAKDDTLELGEIVLSADGTASFTGKNHYFSIGRTRYNELKNVREIVYRTNNTIDWAELNNIIIDGENCLYIIVDDNFFYIPQILTENEQGS